MQTIVIDPKNIAEIVPVLVSFADLLQPGETITGASTTAYVVSGTDPTAQNIVAGSATYTGSVVTQNFTSGLVGVIYGFIILVTASGSHNYAKTGSLAVLGNNPF